MLLEVLSHIKCAVVEGLVYHQNTPQTLYPFTTIHLLFDEPQDMEQREN